jgi:uncharacterized membrane protein
MTTPPRSARLEKVDVAVLLLVAAGLFTLATALPPDVIRTVLVLPTALLLPGYAVALALPGQARDPIPSLGVIPLLSLAFYAFSSLVLSAVGIRLQATSVALSVDVLVAACGAIFVLRRGDPGIAFRSGLGARAAALIALGAAALLALTVVTVSAARVFTATPQPPYTEFALAGQWSRVEMAPFVAPGGRLDVPVSLANRTSQRVTYLITPVLTGVRGSTRRVQLAAGAQWAGSIGIRAHDLPCRQRLVIELARSRATRPLEELALELRTRTRRCLLAARRGG